METGATRNIGAIAHDPPLRRDDVARSHVATELPTTKTVRAAQEASAGNVAGERRGDHPAVKTGFERDLDSGSIVYRWTDQTTERVILEIPRSDRIRSSRSYDEGAQTSVSETTHRIDRSV